VTYISQMFSEGTMSGPAGIISNSISLYRLLSKSRVTVAIASLSLPVTSGKVVANGRTCTATLMYPQMKKLMGGKSGERRGQVTDRCYQSISLETCNLRSASFPCLMWRRSILLQRRVGRTLLPEQAREIPPTYIDTLCH
jgi:hypothetical protein